MIKGIAGYERSKAWARRVFTGRSAMILALGAVAFIILNVYRLNDPLPIGTKVENFTLTNIDNQTFTIYDIKMPIVLVFYKKHEMFSNYVFNTNYRRLLPQLKFIQDKGYAQIIVITDGVDDIESLKKLANDKNHKSLNFIGYVADSKVVSKYFGIRSYPHLFVLNTDKEILYDGKLVSANYIQTKILDN